MSYVDDLMVEARMLYEKAKTVDDMDAKESYLKNLTIRQWMRKSTGSTMRIVWCEISNHMQREMEFILIRKSKGRLTIWGTIPKFV